MVGRLLGRALLGIVAVAFLANCSLKTAIKPTSANSFPVITVADLTIPENHVGPVNLQITLSKAWTEDVTIPYASSSGTAIEGTDYTGVSGTITIFAGNTAAAIPISVIDDTLFEGDENFNITFTAPSNAKLGVLTKQV